MRIAGYIKFLCAALIAAQAFTGLYSATLKEMERDAQVFHDKKDLKNEINLLLSILEIEPDNERVQQQIEEVYENKRKKDYLFEYSKKYYREARPKLKDEIDKVIREGIDIGEKALKNYRIASVIDLVDVELKNKREDMIILEQEIEAAWEKLKLSQAMRDQIARFKQLAREEMKKKDPDYEQALFYWEEVLKIASNDTEALEGKRKSQLAIEDKLKYDKIQGYMASGINYFNNKEYQFAMREFKEVLNLDPRHREAKDYIENINDILEDRKLRAQKEEQAESFYLSGINNANNNRFDAATDDFETTLNLIRDYKDARQRLNDLARRKKEYDEKERARRIKEIDRKFQEGIVAYSQGKYRKARDAFQMTLELDKNNALAKEFLQKTLDALLIEEEEVVGENSPKYAFIYSDIVAGKSLLQKGDYAGSRKKWESILNLQPKNKVARENIVKCDIKIYPEKEDSILAELFKEGKEDLARKEYRAALSTFDIIKSIKNKYPDIDTNIAETKNRIKEGQERNLTFTDKSLDSIYKESLALKEKGGRENYEKARTLLKQVRQKEPDNLNAAILYSQIDSQLSVGIGEAERKKVLSADQRNKVQKYKKSAREYQYNNDILKAINEYKKVLDIDPEDVMAKNNKLYLTKLLTRPK